MTLYTWATEHRSSKATSLTVSISRSLVTIIFASTLVTCVFVASDLGPCEYVPRSTCTHIYLEAFRRQNLKKKFLDLDQFTKWRAGLISRKSSWTCSFRFCRDASK